MLFSLMIGALMYAEAGRFFENCIIYIIGILKIIKVN